MKLLKAVSRRQSKSRMERGNIRIARIRLLLLKATIDDLNKSARERR